MKERKGAFGLMVGGIVDSVVQTARRSRAQREPKIVVYDAAGHGRVVTPADAAYQPLLTAGRELIAAAGRLIELAGPPSREQAAAEAEAAAAEAETQAEAAEAGAADKNVADGDPLP